MLYLHRNILVKDFLGRKKERYEKYNQSIELLRNGMDGLIIYQKHHPIVWLFILLKFLKSGRPFSVYCDRQQPLIGGLKTISYRL